MESIFSRLPEHFFIPLASPNRRHYAALLLLYYRLFMEYRSSVERGLVVARFSEYFTGLDVSGRVVAPLAPAAWKDSHPQELPSEPTPNETLTVSRRTCRSAWARSIARVHEVDPLICPRCGSEIELIAVITDPSEVLQNPAPSHQDRQGASRPRFQLPALS